MTITTIHYYKEAGRWQSQTFVYKDVKYIHYEDQDENGRWIFIDYENGDKTAFALDSNSQVYDWFEIRE